jgi:two-component system NarL family sensor kinase
VTGALAWPVLGLAFIAAGATVARGSRRLGAAVALVGIVLVVGAVTAVGAPAWGDRLWALAVFVVLPVALLLHPDGAAPGPGGRTLLGVVVATGLLALVDPAGFRTTQIVPVALAVLVVAGWWWRHEHAGDRERRALLWLLLGLGVTVLVALPAEFLLGGGTVAGITGRGTAHDVVVTLSWLAVPAALVVGARHPDRGDVRALIVRAVVLAVAALTFVAVFVGAASAIELAGGTPPAAARQSPSVAVLALVGAVCAAGFGPLAALLRGAVDRMLFGDRAAPITAASRVSERLADDPVPALRALRTALALPYAALEHDGRVVAASGTPPAAARQSQPVAVRRLVLRAGQRTAGELVVGLRPGTSALDATDETTLAVVAPALAQTLLAGELARQLQDSRARMITAVEDERRRLRRDLHDGLGPTLTGVAFAADAARNVLAADPARAADLVAGLRGDVAHAIAEIRRLVEGLRPPAVDELGLVGALTQQATRMRAAGGDPLVVRVDVPEPLPALPAAVEVAAYRIVTEALTNVARHSGGGEAVVAVRPDGGRLRIAVRDDGAATADWLPGVGLTSMRERAEQLGGTFRAGGGCVEVLLPIGHTGVANACPVDQRRSGARRGSPGGMTSS